MCGPRTAATGRDWRLRRQTGVGRGVAQRPRRSGLWFNHPALAGHAIILVSLAETILRGHQGSPFLAAIGPVMPLCAWPASPMRAAALARGRRWDGGVFRQRHHQFLADAEFLNELAQLLRAGQRLLPPVAIGAKFYAIAKRGADHLIRAV